MDIVYSGDRHITSDIDEYLKFLNDEKESISDFQTMNKIQLNLNRENYEKFIELIIKNENISKQLKCNIALLLHTEMKNEDFFSVFNDFFLDINIAHDIIDIVDLNLIYAFLKFLLREENAKLTTSFILKIFEIMDENCHYISDDSNSLMLSEKCDSILLELVEWICKCENINNFTNIWIQKLFNRIQRIKESKNMEQMILKTMHSKRNFDFYFFQDIFSLSSKNFDFATNTDLIFSSDFIYHNLVLSRLKYQYLLYLVDLVSKYICIIL